MAVSLLDGMPLSPAAQVVRKSDEGSSRRSRMNMKAIANEINIMAKLNHPNIVRSVQRSCGLPAVASKEEFY